MMHCSEAAELITALVDGELDLEQMAQIKAHLDMCEDCQERQYQEARLKAFLRERLQQVDTPAGLEQRIRGCLAEMEADTARSTAPEAPDNAAPSGNHKPDQPDQSDPPPGNALRMPLTILIVVLASMMGTMLVMKSGGGNQPVASTPLATELAALHVAATGAGVLQVRENDPRALEAWLEARIDGDLRVPDLSGMGLVPVGARTLKVMDTDMAMLLYRDRAATPRFPPVTVVQSPTPPPGDGLGREPVTVAGTPVYTDAFRGIALAHFDADGLTWMLASNQSAEALQDLSRRVLSR